MHKAVFACGSMVLSVFCGSFFALLGEKRPTRTIKYHVGAAQVCKMPCYRFLNEIATHTIGFILQHIPEYRNRHLQYSQNIAIL